MNRLYRVILKEIIGPYAFGVCLFTVLIVATTYLGRLIGFLVHGISPLTVLKLAALFTPGILVKTFAMSTLLAGLLGFGRLSNDSEITAMKAAGASLQRIIMPVLLFSVLVAGIAFVTDEKIVPWAARTSASLNTELMHSLDESSFRSASQPIIENGKTVGEIAARDFDARQGLLKGAVVFIFKTDKDPGWYLSADQFSFDPVKFAAGQGGWAIDGKAQLVSSDGVVCLNIDHGAWPSQVPKLNVTPEDFLASQMTDLDLMSMGQIRDQIVKMKANPNHDPAQVSNLEFGYWNKIALPLAAIIYGLLGAGLGVRNSRQSTAAGFTVAIFIIFGYVFLANWLSVYAQGGQLPAWFASFLPPAIGLGAAIVIIVRRNR